jgi:hypothetical protein
MVRIMRFSLIVLRLMREFVFFIQLAAPWVGGAILFTLNLMATSVISLWVGVPTSVRRIADEWLDRAFFAGFPGDKMPQLYYVICALAVVTIVAGWLLVAHITVWLSRLIF